MAVVFAGHARDPASPSPRIPQPRGLRVARPSDGDRDLDPDDRNRDVDRDPDPDPDGDHRLIDLHTHIDPTPEHMGLAVRVFDAVGIGVAVNLSGGTTTHSKNQASEFEQVKSFADTHFPGRFLEYMNLDYTDWDRPDFAQQAVAHHRVLPLVSGQPHFPVRNRAGNLG